MWKQSGFEDFIIIIKKKKKKGWNLKPQSIGLLLLLLLFWISIHVTVLLRTPPGVQVCKFTLKC